jgi:Cu(I)/Ag(I) efflux system membrane fusion protein
MTWLLALVAGVLALVAGVFVLGYFARAVTSPSGHSPLLDARHNTAVKQSIPTIWTCSMHPRIQQPRPGKCPICAMDLVPVADLAEGQSTSLRQITISPSSKALMNIQTVPVERRFVTAEIRMVGKVDYDETRLGFIAAWVPGRLDRLFVDYTGVEINKGDHMVEIYSPELYAAQEELIMAAADAGRRGTRDSNTAGVSLLEATREKLRLWGMTPEQIQQIEKQERPSDHITIYAPMGGVVIHKNAQEGDYVKVGERIYTVADLSRVWVRLNAYESDLPWLHYGQRAIFTTEAYPGESFEGRIVFIDPVLDPKTRTVKVRVNVANPGHKLKPEMFVRGMVRAQVATGGRVMDPDLAGKWISPMHPEIVKDAPGTCDICGMPLVSVEEYGYVPADAGAMTKPLVIPVSAALVTGTRAIVYVELPDTDQPSYEGREILLGPRAGDFYIVRSGLDEGELVVTHGNFKIDSALQIQAKPSTMTPEGGGGGGHQHDHGGTPAEEETATKSHDQVLVPPAFREQLQSLDEAFSTIADAVQSGSVERIRAAFFAFESDLKALDAGELSGHTAMLWKELAMLLTNDAIEGSGVQQPADAYRVFNETAKRMRRVRERLLSGHHPSGHEPPRHFQTPKEFQGQLGNLWNDYRQVSAALSRDDLPAAQQAVAVASQSLAAVDMQLLKGEAHNAWMAYSKELEAVLEKLKTAENLPSLRASFQPFSNQMTTVILALGLDPSQSVYRLHCPMAFDNRGASWLQADDEVRNPYFGARMFRCADQVELIAGQESSEQEAHQNHE